MQKKGGEEKKIKSKKKEKKLFHFAVDAVEMGMNNGRKRQRVSPKIKKKLPGPY